MNRRETLLALGAIPLLAYGEEKSPQIVRVNKTPTCGCCGLWVQHLEKAGFRTEVRDFDDLAPLKQRLGVPASLSSCHTAEVGGYFIEGHVPAADIQRLLKDRRKGKGLAVPGMPAGSPGMEVSSGRVDRYEVLLVRIDGQTEVFSTYGT
ncbi:MAG TPA: DUF411 domain-containing protein [Povalibacter sp.]|uniref:DUF411 domain-containing protein n=1 Tax=Povalibacter sp. TaxID=1962978 RepID=UPI002B729D00|nr:DUF411 domain-containing protein [Povalibacter sp.]HMN43511.1 DUF411 domain-containing protein [Povalibacter sp.]